MNLFLGIAAFILSVCISVFLSQKYSDRRKFYSSFSSFNSLLKNEVSFSQKTVKSIVNDYKCKSVYFESKIKDRFIKKEEKTSSPSFLSKEEIDYFDTYLKEIGGSDIKTQLSIIGQAEKNLSDNLEKCKVEERKYKKLYIKMGILIGLLVFVLLL